VCVGGGLLNLDVLMLVPKKGRALVLGSRLPK